MCADCFHEVARRLEEDKPVGFVPHCSQTGTVCTCTHHGYGCGLGFSDLQVTHVNPIYQLGEIQFIFQYIWFWLIYYTAETGADPSESDGEEDETAARDSGHDKSDNHSDDNNNDRSDKDDDEDVNDEDNDNDGSVSVLIDVSLAKTIGTWFHKLDFSESALIYMIM